MKKIWMIPALMVTLMSCSNGANDGDANTDTTNFNKPADTGSLSPAYGDTSFKMAPSTGTDTVSRGTTEQSQSSDSGKKQ